MINTSYPSYDAIPDGPSKSKQSTTLRNVLLTITAIILALATAYFVYSGFFVANSGAVSVSRVRLSSEPIIIEYDADQSPEDIEPGTDAWIQFHDKLVEDAGYDAAELRNNPHADVSFVAYDDAVHDAVGPIVTGPQQSRPARSITCFTQYSETGNTNAQKCLSTRRVSNPIRTGCSARANPDGFIEFLGVGAVGTTGCESYSKTDIVYARCCQPTPNSEFEGAAWEVTTPQDTVYSSAGCISASCEHDQDLIGCSARQPFMNALGGVQNMGNMCTAEQQTGSGATTAFAYCASQPEDGHTLKCASVYSMDAETDHESGNSKSVVECPKKTVMFDCNSYLNGRTTECPNTSSNTGSLFGEYLYKAKKKQKVQCIAIGDNQSIRAQATCCSLE